MSHLSHQYDLSVKVPTLRNIDMNIGTDDIVALVGESGCGKTTMGKIIAGLVRPTSGSVLFEGQEIHRLKGSAFDRYRRAVQLIHQDPYSSLNPSLSLFDTLSAGILRHRLATRREVLERVADVLHRVGLPNNADFLRRYPHQFSGGQRQCVLIARALALQPMLIVADEAVSMLDVSMRVAILDLLLELKRDEGLSFLFISHDFGVVRYFASGHRIAVLYFGAVVERGICDEVIANPRHPYTHALLSAVPLPDPRINRQRQALRLKSVEEGPKGQQGCPFVQRCPLSDARCEREMPPLVSVGEGHQSACFYPERVEQRLYA